MSENIKPSKSGKLLTSETWDALRKAGVSEDELQADQPFGPVIFSYTRAQAIEDGVLVDVTPLARKMGFKLHTVITCGVNGELMAMIRRVKPEDFTKYPEDHIRRAAIGAMLQTLFDKIRTHRQSTDRIEFECGTVKLWACVSPGDEGEPVLTVMLIGED